MRALIFLLIPAACLAQSKDEFKDQRGVFRVFVKGEVCNGSKCFVVDGETTGFAIQTSNGKTLICTVGHTFEDPYRNRLTAREIKVIDVDGRERDVIPIGGKRYHRHPSEDLALVAIKGTYPAYRLAKPVRGERVHVYGMPRAWVMRRTMVVGSGETYTDMGGGTYRRIFYRSINAEFPHSGFSGGPVVNKNGYVVGVQFGRIRGRGDCFTPTVSLAKWAEKIVRTRLPLIPRSQQKPLRAERTSQRQLSPIPDNTIPICVRDRFGRPVTQYRSQRQLGLTNEQWLVAKQRYQSTARQDCCDQWKQYIEQRIEARLSGVRNRGEKGEPGKSAYRIATEEGFRGTRSEWIDSLHGKRGATGSIAQVDVAKLARVLATEHANTLKGKDGKSVSPDELRPLITTIVKSLLPDPQKFVAVPNPDEMDRMIDAWVAANSAKIDSRIDARIQQAINSIKGRTDADIEKIADKVYGRKTANVLVIDTSQDEKNPRVVAGPTEYNLSSEPIILDMADFVIQKSVTKEPQSRAQSGSESNRRD